MSVVNFSTHFTLQLAKMAFHHALLDRLTPHNPASQLLWYAQLQNHTLDALAPPFDRAVDQYSTQAARSWYTNQERTELCRALLYAVVLSPKVLAPATVADILGLLEFKATKVKQAGESLYSNWWYHCFSADVDCV